MAIGSLLTFLISDGQKMAARAVLGSADVEGSIGRVDSALLIGSSLKYSGVFGCEDFRYLVFGRDGAEIVKVRIELRGGKTRSRKVVELVEGAGADFSEVCHRQPQ